MPRAAYKRNIMSEQLKLVKTERKLEELLAKVNQSLNVLMVEEMQINSNSVKRDLKPMLSQPSILSTSAPVQERIDETVINKQVLDLTATIKPYYSEEEDSD